MLTILVVSSCNKSYVFSCFFMFWKKVTWEKQQILVQFSIPLFLYFVSNNVSKGLFPDPDHVYFPPKVNSLLTSPGQVCSAMAKFGALNKWWDMRKRWKTTECQGNNNSSSKNQSTSSASYGNTTTTTTRLSYISVVVPPSWKPNNNYKNKTGQRFRCSATLLEPNNNQYNNNKTRPANVSVVVPPSGQSCSVEGHGDGGGEEEQAGQHGDGELK